jgi:hypothetical protein
LWSPNRRALEFAIVRLTLAKINVTPIPNGSRSDLALGRMPTAPGHSQKAELVVFLKPQFKPCVAPSDEEGASHVQADSLRGSSVAINLYRWMGITRSARSAVKELL